MNERLDRYEADREHLLRALARKRIRGWVPAQVVAAAILECGWVIRRVAEMNPQLLGLCCAEARVICIPTDFRQRLRVPATAAQLYLETLAHELAHVRLHAQEMLEDTTKNKSWEQEADDYSRVFLIPRVSLCRQAPMRLLLQAETQEERWRHILSLAKEFRVTGWFLSSALELYGLIRIEKRRRLVEVQPAAHDLVRRFSFGRSA